MQNISPLLVVDIDRTGAFPADQLAFALGFEKAEVVETANDALSALTRRKPGPRYVVVDIGLHGDDMLPVLSSLARASENSAQLVVIGNINDLAFYRALKNAGVFEYFTHPAAVAEVRAALVHHTGAKSAAVPGRAKDGTVIAFMSAASGDGASTIALNTAYALAQETGQPAALVDLDYQFGMVTRHLDLQAQFGIRELFDNPERGVDATLVSKMLIPYRSGLHVVAAPDQLRMLPAIRPDTVRDLVNVLKSQFGCVVLDVPHVWAPWTAEALAQADRIIIVSQLWLRSLTHLSRLLAAWNDAGLDKEKIMLAVNRSGARFREAITPQDFEKVCLKTINFYFANDIKTVVAAENEGKTLVEVGSSLLERQVREMARTLSGRAAPEKAEAEPRARKGLKGLFQNKA
jgi:pilus assembly protein CpaE